MADIYHVRNGLLWCEPIEKVKTCVWYTFMCCVSANAAEKAMQKKFSQRAAVQLHLTAGILLLG